MASMTVALSAGAAPRCPRSTRSCARPPVRTASPNSAAPSSLDAVRAALAERRADGGASVDRAIAEASAQRSARLTQPSQRRVFNLTGTVLHTNLGRAPLPEEAIEAAAEAMRDPSTLEYDLATGRRGERDDHVSGWLTRLTGADAALAVNNNAGALVLALNALALGHETIVSRGELIEIGGSFRLPDIMARAGTQAARGRHHQPHPSAPISRARSGPHTALILKAHTSNYAIEGFTAAVPTTKLAALAHEHGIPFVEDLGSGSLVDLEPWGLPHEPTVAEALAQGADLVTFSGDKLLGGPQAGLVVGRADLSPAREKPAEAGVAARQDPACGTRNGAAPLRRPRPPRRAAADLAPACPPKAEIEALANRLLPAVASALAGVAEVGVVATRSQIGSGALPVSLLPSAALALRPVDGPNPAPPSKPWRGRFAACRSRSLAVSRAATLSSTCAASKTRPAFSPSSGFALRAAMILATAGHIDHGKTALVRALTGVDADRLPEEKRRGLTIDLGFAYTTLPDGAELAFVDVPGHERFLPNMLAGVLSIDRVLLVVAADDGPRPQTIEHLDILELIEVAEITGVVTKTDRVAPERAAVVTLKWRGCSPTPAMPMPRSSRCRATPATAWRR